MKHQNGAIVGITCKSNPTIFQKMLRINDFYWGEPGFAYPMGHVQLLGKVNKDMIALDVPKFVPGLALEEVARRSVDWWLTAEICLVPIIASKSRAMAFTWNTPKTIPLPTIAYLTAGLRC